MIWVGEDGSIMAKSHTILGEAILHGLQPGHKNGGTVEIQDTPSVFFADVPRKTKIGLVNPETGDVLLAALGGLH